jgi:hypothetical protein
VLGGVGTACWAEPHGMALVADQGAVTPGITPCVLPSSLKPESMGLVSAGEDIWPEGILDFECLASDNGEVETSGAPNTPPDFEQVGSHRAHRSTVEITCCGCLATGLQMVCTAVEAVRPGEDLRKLGRRASRLWAVELVDV